MMNKNKRVKEQKTKFIVDIKAYLSNGAAIPEMTVLVPELERHNFEWKIGQKNYIEGLDKFLEKTILEGKSFQREYYFEHSKPFPVISKQNVLFNVKVKKQVNVSPIIDPNSKVQDKTQTAIEEIKKTKIKFEKPLKKSIKNMEDKIKELTNKNEILKLEALVNAETYKAKQLTMGHEAQIKIDEFKERLNLRKKDEVENIKKYASQNLIKDLLTWIKNLDMAISTGSKSKNNEVKAYNIGFNMILINIYNTLQDYGVSLIEPQINEQFNPELHFAFELKENPGFNHDHILKVNAKGFKYHDRIIMPAQVIVCKNKN